MYASVGLEDEPKMDEVTMIIAVTIFILSSPPEVVLVHNVQFPCINLLKQALESQSELVRNAAHLPENSNGDTFSFFFPRSSRCN